MLFPHISLRCFSNASRRWSASMALSFAGRLSAVAMTTKTDKIWNELYANTEKALNDAMHVVMSISLASFSIGIIARRCQRTASADKKRGDPKVPSLSVIGC